MPVPLNVAERAGWSDHLGLRRHALLLSLLVILAGVGAGTLLLSSGSRRELPATRARIGTLTGELAVCCNAFGDTREAGTVIVKQLGGATRVIAVDDTGHFSVALPAGSYHAVGGIAPLGWRMGQCRPVPPSSASPPASPTYVRADGTTHVLIICQGQ